MALQTAIREMNLMDNDYVMVASIDFGTTFSGYAFSFKSNKTDIKMNKNWGGEAGHQSFKTPTSVLLDNRGNFLAFGYEAESKYNDLIMSKGEDSCDLYRHFKMTLHSEKRLSRQTKVLSVRGTPADAMAIFTHAVKYLKDHLIEAVQKTVTGIPDGDLIRWVITVPAIWDEESKSFMREVAFKAGITSSIDSTKFMVSLEPEAASMCCRKMDAQEFEIGGGAESKLLQKRGAKYMVVDAGGGTVDITAHEVQSDGSVRELMAASGGAWGGTQVDFNFIDLLMKILGKEFVMRYQRECPAEWLDIRVNFEKKKKSVKPGTDSVISIQLGWGIAAKYQDITGKNIEKVLKTTSVQGVTFRNGTIVFDNEVVESLFKPVTDQIVSHLREELSKPKTKEVTMMLIVGGFGECAFLQKAITNAFGSRLSVLCPYEAGIAIIKGAVLLGHTPDSVRSRIARKTYGTALNNIFQRGVHDSHRLIKNAERGSTCRVFSPFVRKGEEINVDELRTFKFYPDHANDTHDQVEIFSADTENPMYPDSPTVRKLGVLDVWMHDTRGGLNRRVDVEVRFGSSELHITVRCQGQILKTKIDFLTQ